MESYVARQPILDENMNLYAYELLFRSGTENFMPDVDGDAASMKIILNNLLDIHINKIIGDKKAFINFTEKLLLEDIPSLLPNDKIVIEILEDVPITDELITICKKLKQKGYTIALDDFEYSNTFIPIFQYIDIIKFDLMITPIEEIKKVLHLIPKHITLLAEKIETKEEMMIAREIGFQLFQGFFLYRPEVLKQKAIPANKFTTMQIVSEINKEEFNLEKVEEFILHDLNISYKLLRYVNNATFAPRQQIKSIKGALVLMGEREIKRFMSLIMLLQIGDESPEELLTISCIRARFCELLGRVLSEQYSKENLFTLGLFSLLDVLLETSMENIFKKLPLTNDLKDPLINKKGVLFPVLDLAVKFEQGNWDCVEQLKDKLHIEDKNLNSIYQDACEWSNRLLN
jgi:EAL and modified HD-GYP domain-containing signal transduction protein